MNAVFLRRLLVLGVCALGVGSLYLAPSLARSPHQVVGTPERDGLPTPTSSADAPAKGSAGSGGSDRESTRPGSDRRATEAASASHRAVSAATVTASSRMVPADTGHPGSPTREPDAPRRRSEPVRTGATPYDGRSDRTPPGPVTGVIFHDLTRDSLTISWRPAVDDVGVTSYRVWLDGFAVATTSGSTVEVDWFNDGGAQHVVQVRAVDGAGNLGASGRSRLVNRPAGEPSPGEPSNEEPSNEPSPGEPSNEPTARPTVATRPAPSPDRSTPPAPQSPAPEPTGVRPTSSESAASAAPLPSSASPTASSDRTSAAAVPDSLPSDPAPSDPASPGSALPARR